MGGARRRFLVVLPLSLASIRITWLSSPHRSSRGAPFFLVSLFPSGPAELPRRSSPIPSLRPPPLRSTRTVQVGAPDFKVLQNGTALPLQTRIEALFQPFFSRHLPYPLNTEEVLAKFAQLSPQERFKRKLECLEALKKTFKKLDHDIDIAEFLGSCSRTVEELSDHLQNLQSQLFDVQRQLSYLTEPENVNSLEQIISMEGGLRQALDRIEMQKRCLGNRLISVDCVGTEVPCVLHNGMYLPWDVTTELQPSNMQFLHGGDGQHFMLSGAPGFLSQRINLYSTETSHQGYNGYFVDGMQEVCSRNGQEESFIDLGQSSSLQLQFGAQCSYHSYGMNFFGDMVHPNGGIGLQQDHADFHVNGLEPPKPVFDAELRRTGVATTGLVDQRSYT